MTQQQRYLPDMNFLETSPITLHDNDHSFDRQWVNDVRAELRAMR
jgi:hypothetical protein